jgi:23S rRNA (cytosine1962-C5)-methyltransferase
MRISGKKGPKLLEVKASCNQFSAPAVSSKRSRDAHRPAGGTWISGELLGQFASANTTAHRLFSSAEGSIECFGNDLLISHKTEGALGALRDDLERWERAQHRVYDRLFARMLPRRNEERAAPALLRGDASRSREGAASENGVTFGLDFSAGYSVGLFLDQRGNRSYLRRCGAKSVLNTFAYTCSFSVMAALGGAATVSVDLSRKSLTRGEANFTRNGLDPRAHRFLHDDVLGLLPRLARRGERFDAIILDPPTFSRGEKGRRFQVERDFEDLLIAALDLAEPRARILLSTNCARLDATALQRTARYALKATRRSGTFHREPPLPDLPEEFAAVTLWLLLGS